MQFRTWTSFLQNQVTYKCDIPLDLSLKDLYFDACYAILNVKMKIQYCHINSTFEVYFNFDLLDVWLFCEDLEELPCGRLPPAEHPRGVVNLWQRFCMPGCP